MNFASTCTQNHTVIGCLFRFVTSVYRILRYLIFNYLKILQHLFWNWRQQKWNLYIYSCHKVPTDYNEQLLRYGHNKFFLSLRLLINWFRYKHASSDYRMREKCTTKPTESQYNSQYKEKYPVNAGLTEAWFPTYVVLCWRFSSFWHIYTRNFGN
jgi:hypothetical protein